MPLSRSSLDAVHAAFHPRTVAVAGVSTTGKSWFGGGMFVNGMRHFDRIERIFALNPKGGLLHDGTPVYAELSAVPDDVDLLISAVPAPAILDLIDAAAAKGVKVMHLFTAGFSETGEAERVALEAEAMRRLAAAGIRLIGPNCLGIHSPITGLSWMADTSRDVGRIGMFSQSGMNATMIVNDGERRGLRFSYAISYGNATDLNECDYLDYFAEDEETDIVLGYIEGVKDGPRFVQSARRVSDRKPLVILKGGQTEAGSRAAGSHTGSLAGSIDIWRGASHQTRFIAVNRLDELIDVAMIVQFLSSTAGGNVAIIGGGGGASVLAADACSRAGVAVLPLEPTTQTALGKFIPAAGTSIRNPIDITSLWHGGDEFRRTVEIVAADPNIDLLIVHFNVDGATMTDRDRAESNLVEHMQAALDVSAKPIATVTHPPRTPDGMAMQGRLYKQLSEMGIANFRSVEECAIALRRFLDWRESSA